MENINFIEIGNKFTLSEDKEVSMEYSHWSHRDLFESSSPYSSWTYRDNGKTFIYTFKAGTEYEVHNYYLKKKNTINESSVSLIFKNSSGKNKKAIINIDTFSKLKYDKLSYKVEDLSNVYSVFYSSLIEHIVLPSELPSDSIDLDNISWNVTYGGYRKKTSKSGYDEYLENGKKITLRTIGSDTAFYEYKSGIVKSSAEKTAKSLSKRYNHVEIRSCTKEAWSKSRMGGVIREDLKLVESIKSNAKNILPCLPNLNIDKKDSWSHKIVGEDIREAVELVSSLKDLGIIGSKKKKSISKKEMAVK